MPMAPSNANVLLGHTGLRNLVKWLPLLGNCSPAMHSCPINSPASLSPLWLAGWQLCSHDCPRSRRERGWSLLPAGSLAVLQLLLGRSPSSCSHGLCLRQRQASQAPPIIATVYGKSAELLAWTYVIGTYVIAHWHHTKIMYPCYYCNTTEWEGEMNGAVLYPLLRLWG